MVEPWRLGQHRHAVETGRRLRDRGVPGRIETGRWYDIRIEVQGAHIRCYLDGKLIHDFSPSIKAMYAVASRATPAAT